MVEQQLVDEYHFLLFPVFAGSGTRIVDGFDPTQLTLVDVDRFDSGLLVLTYTS